MQPALDGYGFDVLQKDLAPLRQSVCRNHDEVVADSSFGTIYRGIAQLIDLKMTPKVSKCRFLKPLLPRVDLRAYVFNGAGRGCLCATALDVADHTLARDPDPVRIRLPVAEDPNVRTLGALHGPC